MQQNNNTFGNGSDAVSKEARCTSLTIPRSDDEPGISTLHGIDESEHGPETEHVSAGLQISGPDVAPLRNRGFRVSDRLIPGIVGASDVLAIGVSCALWYAIYVGPELNLANYYITATFCVVIVSVSLIDRAGLYKFETIAAWPDRIGRMLFATGLAAMVLTGLAFLLKISDQFSRVWTIGTYLTAITLIVVFRSVMAAQIERLAMKGRLRRNVAVFGTGSQAAKLITQLRRRNAPWINLVGLFDDRLERLVTSPGDPPVLGNVEDLIANVRGGRIDCIVITLPWSAADRLRSIIGRLQELPVDVYLGADLIGYHYPMEQRQFAPGVSVLAIADLPLAGWLGILKSIADKFLAAFAAVLLLPLFFAIALAIKLESRGSILFRQERYGFNNEVISIYKFRTMYEERRSDSGVAQATRNDPRVTRVGRFLRATSLDELPQLINVLQGNMAIVGPRPHAVEHNIYYAELIAGYFSRHRVKPGITGWAQVNGLRGETSTVDLMQARIECDRYYIENWSPWLDLKIIALTMWVVMRGSNAY